MSAIFERDPRLDDPRRSCLGKDSVLFFPRDGETLSELRKRMVPVAEYYCAACPVRAACRDAGQRSGYGLWGGVLYRITKGGREAVDLLASDDSVSRDDKTKGAA